MTDASPMPPDFFQALARELVAETQGLHRSDIETRVATALKDTFESGMASTLTAVVSAIEAVHVPTRGMVLFKVPDGMMERSVQAFRKDLVRVAGILHERMGFQPIILVVPADVEATVVEFDEVEAAAEGGELVQLRPGQDVDEPARGPRIVALDPLKLRDCILEVLDNAIEGTVTVFPMGSTTVDGIAAHDIRVVLPASPGVLKDGPKGEISWEVVADVQEAVEHYARETNATFKVLVAVEGRVPGDDAPTFTVGPAPG